MGVSVGLTKGGCTGGWRVVRWAGAQGGCTGGLVDFWAGAQAGGGWVGRVHACTGVWVDFWADARVAGGWVDRWVGALGAWPGAPLLPALFAAFAVGCLSGFLFSWVVRWGLAVGWVSRLEGPRAGAWGGGGW